MKINDLADTAKRNSQDALAEADVSPFSRIGNAFENWWQSTGSTLGVDTPAAKLAAKSAWMGGVNIGIETAKGIFAP